MMVRVIRGLTLLLMGGALATGAAAVRRKPDDVVAVTAPAGLAPLPERRGDVARLLQLVRRSTPFRVGGHLPVTRYGATPSVVLPAVPPPPKPRLSLTGVAIGAESAAILEGVPGEEGPVVIRAGEARGVLRVISVSAEGAVVSGFDTTWNLRVRTPWP